MDLSWVSLKLDSEMSPSLLPLGVSVRTRALRQCREGVGPSTERWYGDGVEKVVYRSQDQNLAPERKWGGMGVGIVLKLDQILLCT